MAPAKPILPPLKTPKSMTFPSELHDSPMTSRSDSSRRRHGTDTPISPPLAYAEFLKAVTPVLSSPVSAGVSFPRRSLNRPRPSPISVPSSATSLSFARGETSKHTSTSVPPPSPPTAPRSAGAVGSLRRLCVPPPLYSPAVDSPMSAHTIRSPYSPPDWRLRYAESPRSASLSVRHIYTKTVTYKRSPPLGPPPKGKRRRTSDSSE